MAGNPKDRIQPLLVDGGLSVMPDGFRIFIRCEPEQSARFTKLFAEDGTGRKLPAPDAKRVRYTIAHEIAHTLLFDISTKPPTPTVTPRKGMGIRGLEHACNDIAGVLLLPAKAIQNEFRELSRLLNPNDLLAFAEKALVSRPSLVIRIDHLRDLELPVGIIASAKEREGKWILTAITRHYALRGVLSKATVGAPVEMLTGELTSDLFSGAKTSGYCSIRAGNFECAIETNASGISKKSCLITLGRF